jgi:leader peptidase (prepilin peptidase)/N-methyltransferase
MIELGCGVLSAVVAVRLPSLWEVPAFGVLVAGLVALSIIDLALRRLPTPIVYGTGLVTGLLLVGAAGALGEWGNLARALIGAVIAFGSFAILSLIYPKGLGFGDVRLAGLCGGSLGWVGYRGIVLGFLLASSVGTIAALVAVRKGDRRATIPFGPCLAMGTVAAILVGSAALN